MCREKDMIGVFGQLEHVDPYDQFHKNRIHFPHKVILLNGGGFRTENSCLNLFLKAYLI